MIDTASLVAMKAGLQSTQNMLVFARHRAQAYNGDMICRKLNLTILRLIIISLFTTALTGCTTQAPARPTAQPAEQATAIPAPQTFTDPFVYCSAVGTVDVPDSRYAGEKIPERLIEGYLMAAGIPENPEYSEDYKTMTIWRCMGGKVMVCNFGANLPCEAKANTSKEPTQEMADYCKANSEIDFIPMYLTGHETIYSWRCSQGAPVVLDQIAHVDAAGYLQEIWYPVNPVP